MNICKREVRIQSLTAAVVGLNVECSEPREFHEGIHRNLDASEVLVYGYCVWEISNSGNDCIKVRGVLQGLTGRPLAQLRQRAS